MKAAGRLKISNSLILKMLGEDGHLRHNVTAQNPSTITTTAWKTARNSDGPWSNCRTKTFRIKKTQKPKHSTSDAARRRLRKSWCISLERSDALPSTSSTRHFRAAVGASTGVASSVASYGERNTGRWEGPFIGWQWTERESHLTGFHHIASIILKRHAEPYMGSPRSQSITARRCFPTFRMRSENLGRRFGTSAGELCHCGTLRRVPAATLGRQAVQFHLRNCLPCMRTSGLLFAKDLAVGVEDAG